MADEKKASGRARGGVARAKQLSPEERRAIAKKAADARWGDSLTEVVSGSADRPLRIGEIEIECYVLDDGTRVITQAAFLRAVGRHPRAAGRETGGNPILPILQSKAINPFVTDEIREKARPISFRLPTGGRASGYNAELLPVVCEVYLKSRDAGLLDRQQVHVARQAEILVRGLAHVGIIALVDEATGYQEARARDALAKILEAFVDKELQAWVRTFPDDFYREMFRLRGLEFPTDSVKRPQYFGRLTNDVVYRRLAPGVLEELKRVTPKNEQGRPKYKLFQNLTANIGYPKLREHLGSVVTLMKLSDNWPDFILKLDRIHPVVGDNIALPLESDDEGL